jgi:hypothetical protein
MLWRMGLNTSRRVVAITATALGNRIALVAWVALASQLMLSSSMLSNSANAQQPKLPLHYRHNSENMSPGEIGQRQLRHSVPMRGYYQPVQVFVPEGAKVSLASGGQFDPPNVDEVTVGMKIGQVYRMKVTNIPGLEGHEVFPTIEVVNRLYPPKGLKQDYPIPIELTEKELYYAVNGLYVTRVIYLEPPHKTSSDPLDPDKQPYYEVGHKEDPLKVADQLGRPMAILRMGSRVPERNGLTGQFTFGMPHFERYTAQVMQHIGDQGVEPPLPPAGQDPQSRRTYPRVPLKTSRYPVLPATYR